MPSIFVEHSSRDYPTIVNTKNICYATIYNFDDDDEEKYKDGYISFIGIEMVSGNSIHYGMYKTEKEALAALNRLSDVIELGD